MPFWKRKHAPVFFHSITCCCSTASLPHLPPRNLLEKNISFEKQSCHLLTAVHHQFHNTCTEYICMYDRRKTVSNINTRRNKRTDKNASGTVSFPAQTRSSAGPNCTHPGRGHPAFCPRVPRQNTSSRLMGMYTTHGLQPTAEVLGSGGLFLMMVILPSWLFLRTLLGCGHTQTGTHSKQNRNYYLFVVLRNSIG